MTNENAAPSGPLGEADAALIMRNFQRRVAPAIVLLVLVLAGLMWLRHVPPLMISAFVVVLLPSALWAARRTAMKVIRGAL